MEYSFKGQLHDQYIVGIVPEVKYKVGGYKILYPDKKEILQRTAKEYYLMCAFIFHSDRKKYVRLIEQLDKYYIKGNDI